MFQQAFPKTDVGCGSKCEELNVSTTSPLYPAVRTSTGQASKSQKGQEETSSAWLDLCVATLERLGDVPDERSDRRKLLKIAGGCTIICLLDGASLRSPREDVGGIQ